MSRVTRWLHENFTALDLNLAQRLGRRELDRAVAGLSTPYPLGPRGSSPADSLDVPVPARALRGLEVTWPQFGNGWWLRVSAGSLFDTITTATNEDRPASWQGRVENDDAPAGVGVLVADVDVTPATVPTSPLSQNEVWTVRARIAEVTVETSTAIPIWNQFGQLFNFPSGPKVVQHQVTITVTRGAPGAAADLATNAQGRVIALVFVPAGATSHATSVIFDCRKLTDQAPGPLEVGGSWHVGVEGQAVNASVPVFQGEVWARMRGELVRVAASDPLFVSDITPPGLSWPAATPSAPRLAWLYLAKPGGLVPRPVRRGVIPIGNDAGFTDALQMAGTLVLSPLPPRLGLGAANGQKPGRSGLRWDLRPSGPLTLTGLLAAGNIGYPYQGLLVAAQDAVCVGFVRYTGVAGGYPLIYGPQFTDTDGWVTGDAIYELGESGLLANPLDTDVDNTTNPRTIRIFTAIDALTVNSEALSLPLDGAWLQLDVVTSGSENRPVRLVDGTPSPLSRGGCSVAYPRAGQHAVLNIDARAFGPGNRSLGPLRATLADDYVSGADVELLGVRFPYGDHLVG